MKTIDDQVELMRGFNRFYTNLIGLLNNHIYESPYSLTEVRVLYEINNNEAITARGIMETIAIDEAYLTLGTTIKVAGSEQAFRAVDFDANLAVARAAQRAGAQRIGVVSAMKADPGSRIFYSRVKGELEEAVAALGFKGIVIARPSLLVGDREALGQDERAGEKTGLQVGRWLKPLIPANFRPITALEVARALPRAGVCGLPGEAVPQRRVSHPPEETP